MECDKPPTPPRTPPLSPPISTESLEVQNSFDVDQLQQKETTITKKPRKSGHGKNANGIKIDFEDKVRGKKRKETDKKHLPPQRPLPAPPLKNPDPVPSFTPQPTIPEMDAKEPQVISLKDYCLADAEELSDDEKPVSREDINPKAILNRNKKKEDTSQPTTNEQENPSTMSHPGFQNFANMKRSRPPLKRPASYKPEKEKLSTFAFHMRNNIKQFFKYNKEKLVREDIAGTNAFCLVNFAVDEVEQKQARTWVFFLIVVQLCVNILYGIIFKHYSTEFSYMAIAAVFICYFCLKIFSVGIFTMQRSCVSLPPYDPERDKYGILQDIVSHLVLEQIFICIPAYSEGKDAFKRTVDSVCESNYPKNKLYMLFIVDGNKANCFQNLMSILEQTDYKGERVLLDGVFRDVAYSVFLKEQNRGKRDSQWLFVEILRNMIPEFKPGYVLFVDSDTKFDVDAVRYLANTLSRDRSGKVAGVCGRLQIENFGGLSFKETFQQNFFKLSTMFVVGFQFYEYHFNQILGKRMLIENFCNMHVEAEAAYRSVTCLPGAFSMFRAKYLENVEACIDSTSKATELRTVEIAASDLNVMSGESFWYLRNKEMVKLTLRDFFSKPTKGIIQRNLYELGEDRTLTVRFLERGLSCLYEPRAVAYTECPDTIRQLLLQRRRWNNSTFVNLFMMALRPKLWLRPKTFPVMVFSMFDLIGAYLLPANAIMLMLGIWGPFFEWCSYTLDMNLSASDVVFWWITITLVVIASTKMDSSELFFVTSTFITGILMVVTLYWFIRYTCGDIVLNFMDNPYKDWPLLALLVIFPLLHFVVSIPQPPIFFTASFFYIMLPTIAITFPMYSFFHLDDFTWGNR